MLQIRELVPMAARMPVADFCQQLGPFALVQHASDSASEAAARKMGTEITLKRRLTTSEQGLSLVDHFEDLLVVTLPPIPVSGEKFTLTVGRLPDCDLVLDDESVSRKHATIRWHGQGRRCSLLDLGSRNGTVVNGYRLGTKDYPLSDNDIINFGDFQFCYMLAETLFMKIRPTR